MKNLVLKMGGIVIKQKANIILIVVLTLLSLFIYFLQYLVFHDSENTLFYFFQDLAFVPLQVIMVTIIINRFMNIMDERKKIKKINVIISTFFVDVGTSIIGILSEFNQNHKEFCKIIQNEDFNEKNCCQLIEKVKAYNFEIVIDSDKLDKLSLTLSKYRNYMLSMLGNDNLMEHDSFTDMLWATFHVNDELQTHGRFDALDKAELEHLSNDILRAYISLTIEWINYMEYLNFEYPFLYSMALRKNPFYSS